MELKDQVCTLEQAKRLNDLNIIQGTSLFYYNTRTETIEYSIKREGGYFDAISCFSAFTVAELGEMLPDESETFRISGKWYSDCPLTSFPATKLGTEAQERATLLIFLLENKLVDVASINKQS